jgi:hypothetical protein
MWPFAATIGPALPMHVCNVKESLHTRSSKFLIGAGGLLTAALVRKASAFSRKVGEPLVLPTARKPEETLYLYLQDWE